MPDILISKRELQRRLADASTTLMWELDRRDQRFPKPVKIGGKVAFVESEAAAFIQALITDRNSVEV